MKSLKFLSLVFILFLICQIGYGQADCEKLFMKAMQDMQIHIKNNGLKGEQADSYVLKKNKELKLQNPDCFPDQHEVEHTPKTNNKMKIDARNPTDQDVTEFNIAYAKAAKDCKIEMSKELAGLSEKESGQLLHQCAMDKIVMEN